MKSKVLPILHKESKLFSKRILSFIRENVLEREVVVTGQNVKYDLARLAQASGGPVAFKCLADDSMIYHYMLDENAVNRSLDYLSRRYTNFGGYKEKVFGESLYSLPLKDLAEYNGTDAALPEFIIKNIKEELSKSGHWSPHVVTLYRRLIPFVACMESVGIKIDEDLLEELDVKYQKDTERLRKEAEELAPGISLDSPKQLSNYLFNELRLPIPDVQNALTPKGMPSTSAAVLAYVDHPLPQKIVEYRTLAKIHNTYIKGIKKALKTNGKVYPEYFLVKADRGGGTVSGRLSAKNPAIQTIPRGADIRKTIVPSDPDGILLEFDGSQMELRYAAMISEDEFLMDIFRSGKDPHQATADLCNISRQTAKTVNFGAIYGISEHGLVHKAGLAPRTAKKIGKTIKENWSGLYKYLDSIGKQAVQVGMVSTPYGRWRRVPGATPSTSQGRYLMREAVNFVIQAPASDFVQLLGWMSMLSLEKYGWPIVSIHDGILFDISSEACYTDVVDELSRTIHQWPDKVKEVLDIDVTIPFEFTVKVGKNWREMQELTTLSTERKCQQ